MAPAKAGVIRLISDLSSKWLAAALCTPIAKFTAERIGTGQVSECYRVKLRYAEQEENGPACVILKIAASDPTSRQSGVALGIYEREVRFYNEVAPVIGGPLAPCYYADFEDDFFSILLGDAAPAIVGDDIQGATVEQARVAMAALGQLHGPALREEFLKGAVWLQNSPRINQAVLGQLFVGYVERYKARLQDAHLGIMQRFVNCFDAHSARQRSRDSIKGLVHGDFRLDNLLFGQKSTDCPLTVVDWQTVSYGAPMSDAAYFLGCSLPVETRRTHFDELVQVYHQSLGSDAPLTLEQCKEGVREQSFFGIVMGIVSPMLVERTERGDEMFMTMMERHCAQVLDLNAIEVLPEAVTLEPLRPEPSDEYRHPKKDDALWNESWYFDAVDETKRLGVYVRLGLTPNQRGSWYSAVVTLPGRGCIAVTDFQAPHPGDDLIINTGNIRATQSVVDPLKEYRVTLKGRGDVYTDPAAILRGEKGEPATVELDLIWQTDGDPYMWRLTPRYEIPCSVSGSIMVDGAAYPLNGVPAQRDHSWAARDWWGADWMWCAFHFKDGTRVHGADLRIPGRPRMSVGYIQSPEQRITELTTCACEEQMGVDGLPVTASVTLKSATGDNVVVEVEPKGHGPLRLVAEDGRIAYFTRAWVQVKSNDGKTGVGWIEWNHNQAHREGQVS